MTAFGEYAEDETASTMKARDYKDATDLAVSVHGTQDHDTNTELAHTLGRNQGQENAVLTRYGMELAGTLTASHDSSPCADRGMNVPINTMAVRRLMPVECERLQDFPDGHTAVPFRGKPASDGPRYKAIGNSMAVCCMAWIGQRISFVLNENCGSAIAGLSEDEE